MNNNYILYAKLEGHEVVEVDSTEWGKWFESNNRRVTETILNRRKSIGVSTVFMGMDIGFQEKRWFETMVFGTSINGVYEGYATWDEAEKGHAKMVRRARQAKQYRTRWGNGWGKTDSRWRRKQERVQARKSPPLEREANGRQGA